MFPGTYLVAPKSWHSLGRLFPTKSRTVQKFVLKLLLTSLVFRKGSKRIEGAQLAATLLTLFVIISVGLYVWAHGLY